MFWYKHATCAICMDPIDKPSSGVVLDCKHHPFHASCIVKSLQRDRRCPVCRHAPPSRADESIDEVADGVEVSLLAESESDDGIDSDDEEDEYEHYEKLVTTRLLVGLDLGNVEPLPSLLRPPASPPRCSQGARASRSSRRRTARIRSEETRIGTDARRDIEELEASTERWKLLVQWKKLPP